MSCPNELTLCVYADGELPADEAKHVFSHLKTCRVCQGLLGTLQQENAVLMGALGAEEVVPELRADRSTSATTSSRPTRTSGSSWVWAGVAAAASTPFLLDWLWNATPTLPASVRWVADLGGLGGMISLSRGLVELTVGGQDMLLSSVGFALTLLIVVGTLAAISLRQKSLVGAGAALTVALLAGFAPPSTAHAAEFRFQDEGTVKVDAGESIDDTVFLAGKTAIVAGVVDGDVFAAAERVEITGTVRGNVYSGGESVTIAGEVGGNVHAGGKNVELDTKVGGSGFLAGQNVILTERSELSRGGYLAGETVRSKGRVGKDLLFAAEKMEIGGSVERNVRGYGRQVAVSSSGSVGGDLHVTVPAEDALEVDDGAHIGGETTVDIEEEHEHRAFVYPGFYFGVLAKTLAMLLIGFVLVTLFPSLLPATPESSKQVLRDMGIGFVALIATPVAMLLALMTVIGIPIAIVLAMAYALLLFLSTVVVAYFAGERLPIEGAGGARTALRTGLALLVILFVVEIPFVGGGLSFLIHIFGMGCLLLHLRHLYVDRGNKEGPSTGELAALPAK